MMRLHSLRTVVLFGLVALALLANGRKAIAAARTAPPASPTVALSASTGFRPSRPTGHAQVVVDERHVHHFGALGRPSRGEGLYHGEAFSVDHLYPHRHRSGRLGACQRPSPLLRPRPLRLRSRSLRRKTSRPTKIR